jgi:hypothetical protein
MNTLDIRTTQTLKIKADRDKNFTVNISGFTSLDDDYELRVASGVDEIVKTVGDGITLGVDELTISFLGSELTNDRYMGSLESENKDAEFFLRINITIELT